VADLFFSSLVPLLGQDDPMDGLIGLFFLGLAGVANVLNGGCGVINGFMYGRWFQVIEGTAARIFGGIQLTIGLVLFGVIIYNVTPDLTSEDGLPTVVKGSDNYNNSNDPQPNNNNPSNNQPAVEENTDPVPAPMPEPEPEPYIPTLEDRLLASASSLHGGYKIQPPKSFKSVSTTKGEEGDDWWWMKRWSSKDDGSWMAFAVSGGPSYKSSSTRPRLSSSSFLGPRMQSSFQRVDLGHSLTSRGYSSKSLDKQAVVRVKLGGQIGGRTPDETLYYVFYDNDVLIEIYGAVYHTIEDEELSPYMLGEYAAKTFSSLQAEKLIPNPHSQTSRKSPSELLNTPTIKPPRNIIKPPVRKKPPLEFVTPDAPPVAPTNVPKPEIQVNHKQEFDRALISSIAISKNGQRMACGADDGRTYIIDSASKNVRTSFMAAKNAEVQKIALSADGSLVAVSCIFGSDLAIWNANNGKRLKLLEKGKSPAALAFSPNGKILATSIDDELAIWDVAKGEKTRSIDVTGGALRISWAPNNNMLAIFNGNGDTVVWYPNGDRILYEKHNVRNGQVLAFSPDSRNLIVHGAYPSTVLVNLALGTEEELMRKDFLYRDMVYLEDGRHLAVVSESMVRIWDSQRKAPAKEAPLAVNDLPYIIQLSGDGSLVVMIDATRRGPKCIHTKPMLVKE
jgi:hypothetical protein